MTAHETLKAAEAELVASIDAGTEALEQIGTNVYEALARLERAAWEAQARLNTARIAAGAILKNLASDVSDLARGALADVTPPVATPDVGPIEEAPGLEAKVESRYESPEPSDAGEEVDLAPPLPESVKPVKRTASKASNNGTAKATTRRNAGKAEKRTSGAKKHTRENNGAGEKSRGGVARS